MKELLEKIEKSWWWMFITKNSKGITVVLGSLMVIIAIISIPQCSKRNEETYITKRPNVKIKSVFCKSTVYQESSTSQSVANYFIISIKNYGDATAYDVQIKKKVISLARGTFDLSSGALRTIYTIAPFDLDPRQEVGDTIFIDENPTNMQKIMSGERSITLEYEILYYGDKNKKDGPFVYKYKISSNKDIFENEKAEENLEYKVKP